MEPYKGKYSLIGDLINPDEDLDQAAQRVLQERTGLDNVFLEQVRTFGKVNRHPLGRVVTIAYYALVKIDDCIIQTNEEGEHLAEWVPLKELNGLAFDHDEILNACHERLKYQISHHPIGFELLPDKFTLSKLQSLYEAVLVKPLDKRNFRKKILSTHVLVDLKERQTGVAHRPAKLYKFDPERLQEVKAGVFM